MTGRRPRPARSRAACSSSTSPATRSATPRAASRSSTPCWRPTPAAEVVVRTSAARWLFDVDRAGAASSSTNGSCDTGVVQRDSLHLDERRTIDEAARLHGGDSTRVAGGGGRVPPAARRDAGRRRHPAAGVPGRAPGRAARRRDRQLHVGLDLRRLSRRARRTAGPRAAHPPRVRPRVARRSGCRCGAASRGGTPPSSTCRSWRGTRRGPPTRCGRSIGVPPGHRMVLASFGGLGITGLPLEPLGRLDGWTVVTTGPRPRGGRARAARRARARRRRRLRDGPPLRRPRPRGRRRRHQARVRHHRRVHRQRRRHRSTPTAATSPSTTCSWRRCRSTCGAASSPARISFAGRWQDHLDAVLAQPAPPERPRTDGALVAASHLLAAS